MVDELAEALAGRIPPPITVDQFDRQFASAARSRLLDALNEEALGDQAVPGLRTFSAVSRWDLEQAQAALQLRSGRLLLDLACGRGGPGLWLAQQCDCDLVGIDFSHPALLDARAAVSHFLPPGRAGYVRGTLGAVGLRDQCVDAVWCGDALFFASDLLQALTDVYRVLRPGGRLAMTVAVVLDADASAHPRDWRPLLRHVGLHPITQEETPGWREHMTAMYGLWTAHESDLRAELPEPVVDDLMEEARMVGPRLDRARRVLVVAEKAVP